METKARLAERIRRMFYGGDPNNDAPFKQEDFLAAVNDALAWAIRQNYYENIQVEGDRVIDHSHVVPYTVTDIQVDPVTTEVYFDLPTPVVTLPRDGGVYEISLTQDQFNPFVYVPAGYRGITSSQNHMGGITCYYVQNNQVRIYNNDFKPESLLVKLIPNGEDDDAPISPAIAHQIIPEVLKKFQGPLKEDKVQDNR